MSEKRIEELMGMSPRQLATYTVELENLRNKDDAQSRLTLHLLEQRLRNITSMAMGYQMERAKLCEQLRSQLNVRLDSNGDIVPLNSNAA